MKTTFRGITYMAHRVGKCPVCGRGTTRRRTFMQTVNPWNLNPEGTPKSALEVWCSVETEAKDWMPDFTHVKCGTR